MISLPFFKSKPVAGILRPSPLRPMRRDALPETPYDETDAVARLRESVGLPAEPPHPSRSSLAQTLAPQPVPVAQKPAAAARVLSPKAQARAGRRTEWHKFRHDTVTKLMQAGLDEDQALNQTAYLWSKKNT